MTSCWCIGKSAGQSGKVGGTCDGRAHHMAVETPWQELHVTTSVDPHGEGAQEPAEQGPCCMVPAIIAKYHNFFVFTNKNRFINIYIA